MNVVCKARESGDTLDQRVVDPKLVGGCKARGVNRLTDMHSRARVVEIYELKFDDRQDAPPILGMDDA